MFLTSFCLVVWCSLFSFPTTDAGFTFISGDDSDDYGHCETASSCNYLIVNIIQYSLDASTVTSPIKDILAIGVHDSAALSALEAWTNYGSWTYDIVLNDDITNVNLEDYRMIYIPSDRSMTSGGIECTEIDLLAGRSDDIATYVNSFGGSLMALTQQSCLGAYAWLPVTIVAEGTNLETVELTDNILAIVSTLQSNSLDHCCYHAKFTGPEGYAGMNILATDPADNDVPIILGGLNIILTSEICNDGTDNDGDSLIDLADPDCLETNCVDGIDNNFDGLTDCDDANCQKIWPDCFLVAEICDDGIDNDGDGLTDLDDPDCLETNCIDGIDNNEDGLIDCDDANCQSNWPSCIFALNTLAVVPQTNCQGSVFLNGTDVKCSQKKGFDIFDFFSLSSFRPAEEVEFINALGFSASTYAEDTMINCEVDHDEDYSSLQFLEVKGNRAGSDNFKMLQKFSFTSDETNLFNTLYIKGVYLFQKGSGFGQGMSRVYAASTEWRAHNVSCPNRDTDFTDSYCLSRSNEAIATPIFGWAVMNVTDIFICQMNQHQQFNLLWEQDSTQLDGQSWHSANSHTFAPLLVVYYGTDEPTSQPSVSQSPSSMPSGEPTTIPTVSISPSSAPSSLPTELPTSPTSQPTYVPSAQPTAQPTTEPTQPTAQPSGEPSSSPS